MKNTNSQAQTYIERPPVIVVMGHIDHGKSTLLDFIRESNVVDNEAGGITQHISAYEVTHKNEEGDEKRITFLDTPGHEAFQAMRSRGARVADIAILVVAADDGVKAQTLEALKAIQEAHIPYVVAINKIDKPNANPQTTINSLIENEVYLEGYGGDIPYAKVSAKTGENVNEILDLILLVAELQELKADPTLPAEGVVIESNIDPKKGTSATLIIKNGTLTSGMYITAGNSSSPVRIMEDFTGKAIKEAGVSSPIRITGFDTAPTVGSTWQSFKNKKEALASMTTEDSKPDTDLLLEEDDRFSIPIIIKTDVAGTAEAIIHEIQKVETDRTKIHVLETGIGSITEGDVRRAAGVGEGIIIGFNVGIDASAKEVAKQQDVVIQTFSIIYELAEWIENQIQQKTPKMTVEETVGKAKVLKTFNKAKNKQVLGARMIEGVIRVKNTCTVLRREEKIAQGVVIGLQQLKSETQEISDGEFGARVECSIEIAPGDILHITELVEK